MMFRAPLAYVVAAVIAFLAALHKILYASVLVNDDFMHRAYALQLLSGELPIRDFFDYGMVLMYLASAVAQLLFGYRLLAEALLIGLTVGVCSFLVFELVRRLTESNAAVPRVKIGSVAGQVTPWVSAKTISLLKSPSTSAITGYS